MSNVVLNNECVIIMKPSNWVFPSDYNRTISIYNRCIPSPDYNLIKFTIICI